MYQITSLLYSRNYDQVLSQMDDIYGEQDHIPHHILETVAKNYPDLFQVVMKDDELVGHLIILPFNEQGREKITDDVNDESDFNLDDFALLRTKKTPVYFFVYSIFGKNQRISFQLIQSLLNSMKIYSEEIAHESYLFAECVSGQGVRISEKMGLKNYFSYNFRGEDYHLYKASLNEFIATGLQFRSLNKPSLANPCDKKEENENHERRINTPDLIESSFS